MSCVGHARRQACERFGFEWLNGVVESGCRNTNSGTGVTSREGGGDSGHVYESLVLAGLALLNYNKRAMG